MSRNDSSRADRRTFLQAGAIAAAAAAGVSTASAAQEVPAKVASLPRRKLGKTGVEVTILNQGAVRTKPLERILRYSFASGVRVFDTAKVYGTEPDLKAWFAHQPEVRKQIFLVTKDMPRTPGQMLKMVDERLAALETDYIDLFFVHGLGDMHSADEAVRFIKSPEFKNAADTIRKSGKAKFVGFSTHHRERARMIEAAAEAGYVDAIMLQYTPWLDKNSPLNRALDVAWKNGIGLISMKQIAGKFFGDTPKGDILEDVKRKVPLLDERKLTPFQGLLHAIWTDERISTVCTSMKNSDQIRENVDAARSYQPVKAADLGLLRDAVLAHAPTLCADCDGRCARAAGTRAELGDLTRFLTYYQFHGHRDEARRAYAKLAPEARDWSDADLAAARDACPSKLDFAQLLPEVEKHLA